LLGADGRAGHSISINPYATGEAVFRLVTYGLVFWLALQFSVNERLARGLLWGFVASVVLYGLYGLGAHLSGSNTILWLEKWAYQNRLTGPFVNANSFATYLGMGLVAITALLLRQIGHSIDPTLPIRRRMLQALDVAVGRGAVLATCALLLAAALALTASRAGMAATLLGLVVMLQLRREGSRRRMTAWIGTVLVGAVLFVAVALSGEQLSSRFDDTVEHSDARWSVYVVTGRMIASAPILGTGYGTFEDAFTAYRDLTISATHTWDKAHNSYLETILGLGIPVGLALIAAIGLLVWRCAQGARKRRRNKIYPAVAAGLGVLIGAHAVVDFSIQMPAVAAVFAAMLGLGIAQSKSPRERGQE
jgi:O-antigen ligase